MTLTGLSLIWAFRRLWTTDGGTDKSSSRWAEKVSLSLRRLLRITGRAETKMENCDFYRNALSETTAVFFLKCFSWNVQLLAFVDIHLHAKQVWLYDVLCVSLLNTCKHMFCCTVQMCCHLCVTWNNSRVHGCDSRCPSRSKKVLYFRVFSNAALFGYLHPGFSSSLAICTADMLQPAAFMSLPPFFVYSPAFDFHSTVHKEACVYHLP